MRTKKIPYLVNLKSFLKSKCNPSKHMDLTSWSLLVKLFGMWGHFEDTHRALRSMCHYSHYRHRCCLCHYIFIIDQKTVCLATLEQFKLTFHVRGQMRMGLRQLDGLCPDLLARSQNTGHRLAICNLGHSVQQGFLPLVLLTSRLDNSVVGAPHVH